MPQSTLRITKAQVQVFQILRKDVVQHLAFGGLVFVVVFCFFAIHAWYQGKAELLEALDYKRKAFWIVFREALLYTFMMGVPVYFNLIFIYKGRVQAFLEKRIFTRTRLQGWGFHIFLTLSFFTSIAFALLYAPLIHAYFEIPDQKWYELSIVILFLIICTTGVSFTKEAIEHSRELERKSRQEAIRRGRELERELNFIKKQIRPHFLFNTLANLQVLARRKADNLPELIGELSRLLRHLVYKTNEKLAPLEDELNFIESYISLQRLQLSRNTELLLETEGEVKALHRIAPMILLLFVENCFKHYNSKGPGKKLIHIHFQIEEDYLYATIRNTFKPNARNEDTLHERREEGGVGLATALENLNLVYKGRQKVNIGQDGQLFTVQLQIPLL
ncbi:MAG: histidine kinase [Phaeodactylibacter sp.]|nr:histidine kinase [Phaeodactylibacter sp.]MCB9300471.1 histidine kinase [Lewinellaceae bacterium]